MFETSKKWIVSKLSKPKTNQRDITWTPNASWGMEEPPPIGADASLKHYRSWVYAAITSKAQEMANIKIILNKRKGNDIDTIETHPALDLMDKVNNQMAVSELITYWVVFKELMGEAYWWVINDNRGVPVQIYPYLRPDLIDVVPSKDTNKLIDGYLYTLPGKSSKIPFTAEEIIQFKYINPENPYRGLAPLVAAGLAISSDTEAANWAWRFFKNNATPRGVLEVNSPYSETKHKQLQACWDAGHKGTKNNNKVAILFNSGQAGGVKYQSIGESIKDMDFLNLRKTSKEEIMSIFKVPNAVINPDNITNRATVEATRINFLQGTILPMMKEFTNNLTEFLLPRFKGTEGMFFDYVDPVPQNKELDYAKYQNGLMNGWLTINEVRNMEGLEPLKEVEMPKEEPIKDESQKEVQDDGQEMTNNEEDVEDEDEDITGKKYLKMIKQSNARLPRRTIQDQIKTVAKKEVIKELKTIEPKKKEIVDLEFEKRGELAWRKKILQTDTDEDRMQQMLKEFFDSQERRLIQNVQYKSKKKEKAVSFDYDVKIEDTALGSSIDDFYYEIVTYYGTEALKDLGLAKEFIMKDAIKKVLNEEALKVAKGINETTKQAIKDQITQGIELGESERDIMKRIKSVFDTASTLRAKAIARSEVARASNYGAYQGYIQSGVVEKVKFFTASDERVCDFCRELNGKEKVLGVAYFNKGDVYTTSTGQSMTMDYETVMSPPIHTQCRCVLLPITSPIKSYLSEVEIKNKQYYDSKLKQIQEATDKKVEEKQKEFEEKKKEVETKEQKLEQLISKLNESN